MQIKFKKQDLDVEFLRKQNAVLKDITQAQKSENTILKYTTIKTWFLKKTKVEVVEKYTRFFGYWEYTGVLYERGCVDILDSFVRLPFDKEIYLSQNEWFSLQNNIKWYDKYLAEEN